jgi:hypothetical protein
MDVDHINADRNDNRRENLRVCTRSQNMANMKRAGKGVCRHRDKWKARITVNYKSIYLGCFDSKSDALAAYESAAAYHFGDYASVGQEA